VRPLLEGDEGLQGAAAEPAVEGADALPVDREQELEDGDVEPDHPELDRSRAEERPAELPECLACRRPRLAGHWQPGLPLQRANGARGRGARDAVDRAGVEALGRERDLQAGDLRIGGSRRAGVSQHERSE
jgi:hypothetical protein